MKRWLIGILAVLLLCSLLISCTRSPTGAVTDDVPEEKITITKHSFDPIVLYTKIGTKVTWSNRDNEPHTITLLGKFDSGTLGRYHSFSHTFEQAGTYTYSDLFNEQREGKVVVK